MRNIEQHIDEQCAHLKDQLLYIACSAGLDSTVLLHVLNKLGYQVEVLHVNYHLRGEASNEDAYFLDAITKKLDVAYDVLHVYLDKILEREGGNLQQEARNHRYRWFMEKVNNSKGVKVLLAHHLEDQTETFFMNVARKSGILGLASMEAENRYFLRPMLEISKNELREYAIAEDITWREDQSNKESKYRRNKLRNIILPELRKHIPELDDSVRILTQAFQEKQKELDKRIAPLFINIESTGFLLKEQFDALTDEERIALFNWFNQPVSILREVEKLTLKGSKVQTVENDEDIKYIVYEGDGFSFVEDNHMPLPALNIEKVTQLPENYSKDTIYLDAEKISGELNIRYWAIGDRISPIGMKGSQLVSDIIANAKLRADDKQLVTVVHDDKQIHWVPGLKVGRLAIASGTTNQILSITLAR